MYLKTLAKYNRIICFLTTTFFLKKNFAFHIVRKYGLLRSFENPDCRDLIDTIRYDQRV